MPINEAPGIDGYEVYHPRWSNHARFMVMTGPYVIRAGGNRIRGGGNKVEVHLGKFTSDFDAIEGWVRISHNDKADFFPDVWIEGGEKTSTGLRAEHVENGGAAWEWTENTDGLVLMWGGGARAKKIPKVISATAETEKIVFEQSKISNQV